MTTNAPTLADRTALLRGLLADTCTRLNHDTVPAVVDYTRDRMGDALVALLLDDAGPATTLVAACLYSVHLRPGMGDYLAEAVDRVASAAADVERGYRVDQDGSHTGLCSHAVGCDDCAAWWADHLDDAVRELLFLLGDRAVADLTSVACVGRGVTA